MKPYFVALSGLEPRFKGNARLVFVHPDDPDLLIKVPRPEWIAKTHKVPAWKKRFKPLGANSVNMHEFREIIRINPKPESQQPHMFSVVGMQQTDLGWGLTVKAEKDANNAFAPPVAIFANNPSPIRSALEQFEIWIRETPAILYDLNPWNLVLANRNGEQQIVIIDGISEKSALQTRTYFPSINAKKNLEVYQRFQRHMERLREKEE
ncbi:YrbL family protein [Bartonella sp. LJL80]